MANIKIKVYDEEEVIVPGIFKTVIPNNKEYIIDTMFRVLPDENNNFNKIQYVLPTDYDYDICSADCYEKEEFENAVEITKDEWNDQIRKSAQKYLEKNLIK